MKLANQAVAVQRSATGRDGLERGAEPMVAPFDGRACEVICPSYRELAHALAVDIFDRAPLSAGRHGPDAEAAGRDARRRSRGPSGGRAVDVERVAESRPSDDVERRRRRRPAAGRLRRGWLRSETGRRGRVRGRPCRRRPAVQLEVRQETDDRLGRRRVYVGRWALNAGVLGTRCRTVGHGY
jgi:hypothetical protein